MGPRFEGCGESPPGDAPLPREEVEVCFSDTDCSDPDECADIRCLAGTCTRVADVLDRDGDGVPPTRCGGTDCDDFDARVFPGAREACNAIDEDCDEIIDEDAPGETLQITPPVFDASGIVVPWGSAFALTDNQPGAIFAWPVALDGSVADPIELIRLRRGSMFTSVIAATNATDTLVLARTDIGAVLYAVLRDEEVVDSGDLEHEGQVVDLAVVSHADGFAIAADLQLEADVRRVVRTRLDEPATDVGFGGVVDAPVAIASTGSDVAVRVEEGVLFVIADVRIEAPEVTARRSLASAVDRVVVGFDDGFGLALRHYDATGPLGSAQPGPSARTFETNLRAVDKGVGIFGRTDTGTRGAWVLDDTLTRYVRTFIDLGFDEGAISAAHQTNAAAYYGAGTTDPRLMLLTECE